jgi:PAP2 superfamily
MGHRVNRPIVLVFVSFLLAGLVLSSSAQMASGPIEPSAGTWQECPGTGGRDSKPWEGPGRATGGDTKVTTRQHVSARNGIDPVLDWNVNMVHAILSVPPHPFGNRAAAITHVAMFTALNSITEQYEPYQGMTVDVPPGSSLEAAVIAAAHAALVGLYPTQQSTLDMQYATSLAAYNISASDPGLGVGKAAAATLALRANDGHAIAQFPYTAPGAGHPGVWVPTPPAFAAPLIPGWGARTPWVLNAGSQYRPEPPPKLTSSEYTNDYNEVKAYGQDTSSVRTAFQTDVARWWVGFAVTLWNPIARQVAARRGLTVSENARLFALMNMAADDAAINSWETKFFYNQWRPITAIRQGDSDGNPNTVGDPNWNSLIVTPPFPDYTGGHPLLSTAMATVLIETFGDNPGVPFPLFSNAHPQFVHTWETFSQGIDEVIDARVWGGIHWRTSDTVGVQVGKKIGRHVLNHALRCKPRP